MDTVLKYLRSPNLYSQACAGSTWKGVARCPLRGVLELSRISRTGCEPHDFHTTVLDYSPLNQETQQCCACFHSPQAPADGLAPIPPAGHHSPAVPSTHPQQSSSNHQQDEAPRLLLRTCQTANVGWFRLKPRNLTRFAWKWAQFRSNHVTNFNKQSLGFDFLVKLETTCVPHGLGFCCEYLTQLYGNSLFLWAFSISYPSQNCKKRRLENMKTTIMWKKGGLNFLNLRQRLCSFRAQSEVLN